jgi:predicted RNase H-like HicB family nuclease
MTYTAGMRQLVLYPDHEDGGWVVEVPSLPGCLSQGHTREEAIANARDAIETWIAGAVQSGIEVPQDTLDVQICIVP